MEEKKNASFAASKIVEEAEKECANLEKSTAEVCKAYRISQRKAAEESAIKTYQETLEKQEEAARKMGERILANSEVLVSDVVGRIIRGDC